MVSQVRISGTLLSGDTPDKLLRFLDMRLPSRFDDELRTRVRRDLDVLGYSPKYELAAEATLTITVQPMRVVRRLYVKMCIRDRPGSGPVSRQLIGGYVELSYDLLRLLPHSQGFQLIAFGRYERTDTQLDVVDSGLGLVRKPGLDRTVYTAGLTFRPILEVALKFDYQHRFTEVSGSNGNQINVAVAYQF